MTTSRPRSKRNLWAALFLFAALLFPELFSLFPPFWQVRGASSLASVSACADQFKPYLEKIDSLGYFYETPGLGLKITDNRHAPQLQIQYALVPKLLDNRPEQLEQYKWVIGYFQNEKVADSLGEAIAPGLGLQVKTHCQNYVLFQRSS